MEEVIKENLFKPTHSRDNIVTVKDGEIQIRNFMTKKRKSI